MYQVFKSRNKPQRRYIAENGEIFCIATMRYYGDYYEEVIKKGNESAIQMMSFTTAKGNTFVVWYDVETEDTFITQIANEKDSEQ